MTTSVRPPNWPHRWFGQTWTTRTPQPPCTPWVLTEAELLKLYATLPRGESTSLDVERIVCEALNVECVSHRKADRALQLLKRAGLIEYAGSPRHWRRVTP